jgi:hypothetical protein
MVTAQKMVSVSGEYTYYAPSTMTLDEAKQEALNQTKLHVLEARFGTLINSTTTLIIVNQENDNPSSRADVRTLSTHEVKGEWIEDTRPAEQTISTHESMPNAIIIHSRVWGKAREVISSKADIEVALLKAPYKEAVEEVFKNEQEFYLYFKSPTSGYLAVYLLDTDENMAYCLLPTSNDLRGNFQVKNNEEYILFNENPTYIFTTKYSLIYNHIAIVFSPNEFYKANDKQGSDDKYILPREVTLQQYQEWLARCKARDAQMIEKQLTVQIVK